MCIATSESLLHVLYWHTAITVCMRLLSRAEILLWCGYAGSSLEVKTETDSEDVMEYLLSLNTSQVRTST